MRRCNENTRCILYYSDGCLGCGLHDWNGSGGDAMKIRVMNMINGRYSNATLSECKELIRSLRKDGYKKRINPNSGRTEFVYQSVKQIRIIAIGGK